MPTVMDDWDGLASDFERLFGCLRETGYAWEPLRPDYLQALRNDPGLFDPWVRWLGVGTGASSVDLIAAGAPPDLLTRFESMNPAVSRLGERFVAHHHWADADCSEDFVYLGTESFELIRCLESRQQDLQAGRVLDLGSGSGAISLFVAQFAREVLGVELAPEAVRWAKASARAQRVGNVRFIQGVIGTSEAEAQVDTGIWDVAVFNPPMAVPSANPRPARDGGRLGLELPLAFLDFAEKKLAPRGKVFCLATNPIVQGESVLFSRLKERPWRVREARRLDSRFNQSLARKENYGKQGIRSIELWFLDLERIDVKLR